jgi:translation initiation factor 3 subunit A
MHTGVVVHQHQVYFVLQDLAKMDVDDIMAKQVEQLEKEKKDLNERLRNQEKKV